jgi:uncharacterized membrane protein
MSAAMRTLTTVTAVGAGVAGGVFFAFSTFVMQGLRAVPPRDGLVSMQAINRAAPTPAFMVVLLGTAAACVGLGIWSLTGLDQPGAWYRVIGCGLYLAAIVLTVAYHVPHNDALALVDPDAADAARRWVDYAGPWTALNHVRTLTSVAGAALLVIGSRA